MRRVTPVIGFLLGLVVGVGALLATARLDAGQELDPGTADLAIRRQIAQQPGVRLIEIPAPRGQARLEGFGQSQRLIQAPPGLVFFKDVNSDGCWLAALSVANEAIALATAPAAACQ